MTVTVRFTYHDVVEALTDEWQSTQEVARKLGGSWRPGSQGLRPVRESLYALHLAGSIDHQPRHSGHLWRRRTQ